MISTFLICVTTIICTVLICETAIKITYTCAGLSVASDESGIMSKVWNLLTSIRTNTGKSRTDND